MDKSLVRSTNKIIFSFFGKCTKMKMVSLGRRHHAALNDDILMEFSTVIPVK